MDKAVQTLEIIPPLPKQWVVDSSTQTEGTWGQTRWRCIQKPDLPEPTVTTTVQTVAIHVPLVKVDTISVMSQTNGKQPPTNPTKQVSFIFPKKGDAQETSLWNIPYDKTPTCSIPSVIGYQLAVLHSDPGNLDASSAAASTDDRVGCREEDTHEWSGRGKGRRHLFLRECKGRGAARPAQA